MRRIVVAVIIIAISAVFTFLLITRERQPLPAIAKASTETLGRSKSTNKTSAVSKSAASGETTTVTASLNRPLRVVSHGWDLLIPGLLAKSNGAFSNRGLDVETRSVKQLADIQKALAAGGDSEKGADIAIVALPLLAITYEDLRALNPQLFWIVGFSRGRDALYSRSVKNLLGKIGNSVTVVGDKDRASMFLSLFVLELAGVELSNIRVLDSKDKALAKRGTIFTAIDRTTRDAEKAIRGQSLMLSSADVTNLIPYVAIASEGFLAEHADVTKVFASGWLAGLSEMRRDVPKAIRSVAALDGTPEPVALLKQIGQIDFADLNANAQLFGLSGRGAVTVHTLFRESFRIWRGVQVITTPGPSVAPVNARAVTALVFARSVEAAPIPKPLTVTNAKPMLISRSNGMDEFAAVERVGLLAGIFARSVLEIGFDRKKKATEAIIARASKRFDIEPGRLATAAKRSKRKSMTVAIMPNP